MNIEVVNLHNSYEKNEVIKFLKNFNLSFDKNIDYTLVLRKNDQIVATASKSKDIIKCFAVDNSLRGEGITNTLVTTLLNRSFEEGYPHNFVFTKPSNEQIFKSIGFKSIITTDKVALLEIGIGSIDKTVSTMKKLLNWDDNTNNGLLVMNCNPFTLGHQYLIEYASQKMDNILVLIVEEDKSFFPFVDRIKLVKTGCSHLNNVTVLPSTHYIISSATFPNYFLKKEDDSLKEYMKLDTTITAKYFCLKLGISTRFVGDEPFCQMTKKYNETMLETFTKYGLNLFIIPRKENNNIPISASFIRHLLKNNNIEATKPLLPSVTYNYLISKNGKEIIEQIQHSSSIN